VVNVILSDRQIRIAIRNGLMNIYPFDIKKLGPVSYDLTVGELFIYRDGKWVKQDFPFICSKGQVIGTKTLETVSIFEGTEIVGIESLRSGATREGLFGSYSCLIDPGFSGRLTVTLCPMLKEYKFTKGCSVSQILFFDTFRIDKYWKGKEKQYGNPLPTSS